MDEICHFHKWINENESGISVLDVEIAVALWFNILEINKGIFQKKEVM